MKKKVAADVRRRIFNAKTQRRKDAKNLPQSTLHQLIADATRETRPLPPWPLETQDPRPQTQDSHRQCSKALMQLTQTQGEPMPLPSAALPPV